MGNIASEYSYKFLKIEHLVYVDTELVQSLGHFMSF